MRAWIEIVIGNLYCNIIDVALFMRAWIEIQNYHTDYKQKVVALFMRAWIEILHLYILLNIIYRRPLHEGVD